MDCPICFDLLQDEIIFDCCNYRICSDCNNKINKCPICRQTMQYFQILSSDIIIPQFITYNFIINTSNSHEFLVNIESNTSIHRKKQKRIISKPKKTLLNGKMKQMAKLEKKFKYMR